MRFDPGILDFILYTDSVLAIQLKHLSGGIESHLYFSW